MLDRPWKYTAPVCAAGGRVGVAVGWGERGAGRARKAREQARSETCSVATRGGGITRSGYIEDEGSAACPTVRKHGNLVCVTVLERPCVLAKSP